MPTPSLVADGNDLIWGDNADGQPAQGEASDTISGGIGEDTIRLAKTMTS